MDDEVPCRNAIARLLTLRGCEVSAVENGLVAERALAKERFDWMITDLFMPEREGLETIVSARRAHPEMRVIAMSGCGDMTSHFLGVARSLGATAVLAKPFSFVELCEAIGLGSK